MLKKITKNTNLIFILLAVLFSLPAVISLLHAGFPLTDDGNWMAIRFSAFYENLRAGQFPVRFLSRLNFGYGYPVSDFLYPLFMYIGVPIHILGFNFSQTLKVIFGLSIISSALFSFLWLRKIFDNVSSLVGSLFYTLFPYHLFDLYVRGSVGEVLSLAILPFVLWQIERRSLVFVSVGLALLIVAHNTLAFLFLPLILVYLFLRHRKQFKFNILTLVFGLLISSFFWIPALYDSQFTVFGKTQVSDFSSYFINQKPQLLGIAFLFLVIECIFYLIRKKDKNISLMLLSVLVLSLFTFSVSETFWKLIPITNLIQFPFRLISLIIPASAFMAAYLLSKESSQKKYLLVPIYLVLIFIASWSYLSPKSFQTYDDSFYSTNQDSTTVRNEYMPIWVKKLPAAQAFSKVNNLSGKEAVTLNFLTPNKVNFNVLLNAPRNISVNTIYFPGWEAFNNGKKININYNNDLGLIRLSLPKGENNVLVKFSETPVRIFADLLTIIGVILIISFNFLGKKFKHKII